MDMEMTSQVVAGDGVEHAPAQEGGADYDVENVKHGEAPGSATDALHAGVACCAAPK
jgi:hypothetical protein